MIMQLRWTYQSTKKSGDMELQHHAINIVWCSILLFLLKSLYCACLEREALTHLQLHTSWAHLSFSFCRSRSSRYSTSNEYNELKICQLLFEIVTTLLYVQIITAIIGIYTAPFSPLELSTYYLTSIKVTSY